MKDYNKMYDEVIELQEEIKTKDMNNYLVVKALAATYELQYYLAAFVDPDMEG